LELAIDRAAINQVVFNGENVIGNQWVAPHHAMYQQSLPVPKRDVAAAKKLLAEAGVKTPITVELMVPNNPETRQVAEVIQSMVKEAGFELKIRVTEFATSLTAANKGDFEAFLIGWSGRTDPDGNLFGFIACKAPFNDGRYCDPEVEKLLGQQRQANDPAQRKKLFEQIAMRTLKEGPIIYLYHRRFYFAHTTKLQGFKPMPDGLLRVVGLKL
jgi:peptide/nickel transport system substrate-binding protein